MTFPSASDYSDFRDDRQDHGAAARGFEQVAGEIALDLGGCKVKAVQSEAPHTDDSTLIYVENDKTLFSLYCSNAINLTKDFEDLQYPNLSNII